MLVGAFVSEFIDLGVKCVFFSRERSQSVRFLCICLADLNEIGYKNMVHHTYIYSPLYAFLAPIIMMMGAIIFRLIKCQLMGRCVSGFFFHGKGGGWWLVFGVFFVLRGVWGLIAYSCIMGR